MTEWREQKLSDFMDFNPYTPLSKGIIAKKVTMEKLIPFNRKIQGYEDAVFSGGTKFKNGDTLVARITPCLENGKTAYVDFLNDEEVAFGSTEFIVLRAKEGISDSRFIFYFAISDEFRDTAIQLMSGTSGRQRVDTEALKRKVFTLPPLPEQKAIAEVLSSLDDKIDLLTKQNKTLEDLAQAYFRKWFIEDASDEWEVGKLGDFVEVIDNRGKTPPYQDIPTEYPIIEVKSISGDNRFIDYQKCEKFVLESTYKTWFRGYIKPLDVLVSTVGSVGEIAQVLLEHGVIAQNVIGLRSKGTSPYHLFEYMKCMKNEIKELDIGSVQPSIKVPHLLSLQYVKPDRDSLRKFDDFSKELVNKMISNFMQIQTLQKLRDTLLPKLISGEIRVKM